MKIYSCAFIAPTYSSDSYMLIVSFLLVIVVALITTKLLVKSKILGGKGRNIEIIERSMISSDKQLLIVKLNDRFYFLSTDKHTTSLIDKLDDFEPVTNNDNQVAKFSDVLDKFKHTKDKKNDK